MRIIDRFTAAEKISKAVQHNAAGNTDDGSPYLCRQFYPCIKVENIVQTAHHSDQRAAGKDPLDLVCQLCEKQSCQHKAAEDSDTTHSRHRFLVDAPGIGLVNRADAFRKFLHLRNHYI